MVQVIDVLSTLRRLWFKCSLSHVAEPPVAPCMWRESRYNVRKATFESIQRPQYKNYSLFQHNVSVHPRTIFRRVLVWTEMLWWNNLFFLYCDVYLSSWIHANVYCCIVTWIHANVYCGVVLLPGYTLMCTVELLSRYTLMCTAVLLPGYMLICTVVFLPRYTLMYSLLLWCFLDTR